MNYFEKYRDHALISKLMAYVLFLDAGTSVLNMFGNMIKYDFGFNFWTILYQAVPVIAGAIFLLNKHQDKLFKLIFSGAYVVVRLIALIRTITGYAPTFIRIFTALLSLAFSVAFALYYLGAIRPSGRKNFFIVMYAIIGVAAIFSIFNHPISSVSTFAMCSVLAMYGYQETRAANSTIVYAGMIGIAYYMVYSALGDLLSIISLIPKVHLYLPGFFSSMNILLCLAMPLLVYDRIVPGEGAPFSFDLNAILGAAQPAQYQQPVQQNNFDPMTGQPIQAQQPVQQNNFDPMTGQPIQAQQPVQQNNFDPMTGQPIDPNNNGQ